MKHKITTSPKIFRNSTILIAAARVGKRSLIAGSIITALSACVATGTGGTSSEALSSSVPASSEPVSSISVAVSSSSAVGNSVSSSVSSSGIESSSSSQQSSIAPASSSMSAISSSSDASQADTSILPRTSCPEGPTLLEVPGGSWVPAYAHETDDSQDAVADFQSYLEPQPVFAHRDIQMVWSLHTPYQIAQGATEKFPLIIYLHGGAEARIDQNGAAYLDNRHAKPFFASVESLLTQNNLDNRPAYILAPFCDGKATVGAPCSFGSYEWASNGFGAIGATLNGEGSAYGSAVEALVEMLMDEAQVDPARIYVTGPSMGGGGTWDFAARRPDLIAAAIPMAGHPLSNSALQILANFKVPVWSHHGQRDTTNPYSNSKAAIDSLAAMGGCAWQTTYIPSANLADDDPADSDPSDAIHNIWARAYTNPELWDWVFAQKQPQASD